MPQPGRLGTEPPPPPELIPQQRALWGRSPPPRASHAANSRSSSSWVLATSASGPSGSERLHSAGNRSVHSLSIPKLLPADLHSSINITRPRWEAWLRLGYTNKEQADIENKKRADTHKREPLGPASNPTPPTMSRSLVALALPVQSTRVVPGSFQPLLFKESSLIRAGRRQLAVWGGSGASR